MLPQSLVVTTTLTRPADTTQYTAGDQVADSTSAPTPLTFANAAQTQGGSGVIKSVTIISSAKQATAPTLDLYIFDSQPTPNNDNAAWAPADSDAAAIIAKVVLSTWTDLNPGSAAAGNALKHVTNLTLPFRTPSDSRDLYGLLVERGTYTPVSGEVFTVRLGITQD